MSLSRYRPDTVWSRL